MTVLLLYPTTLFEYVMQNGIIKLTLLEALKMLPFPSCRHKSPSIKPIHFINAITPGNMFNNPFIFFYTFESHFPHRKLYGFYVFDRSRYYI